jgi:CRISPR-associated endoribonuclease Cas6
MRLLFDLTPPHRPLGFDYPYKLCSVIHRWLGFDNPWHDRLSLYSFGWLTGGQFTRQGLVFPEGASWFVSSYDSNFLAQLMTGAYDNREVCFGMRIRSIKVARHPAFRDGLHTFRVSGPILLKSLMPDQSVKFLTFLDGTEADQALTHSIHRKLDYAGLSHWKDGVRARFKRGIHSAKTKLVQIKNIQNRASQCPIEVEAPQQTLRFIWLTGVGNSTGVGFGGME